APRRRPGRCWRRPRTRRRTSRPRMARREAQVTAGDQTKLTDRPGVLDGPFSTPQLLRLDEALRLADESTGLCFSVYVGGRDGPVVGGGGGGAGGAGTRACREAARPARGPRPLGTAGGLAEPAGTGDRHRRRRAPAYPGPLGEARRAVHGRRFRRRRPGR